MTVVGGAAVAGSEWQERARFALLALLRFLAERPEIAQMAVMEVLAAGPSAVAERDRAVSRLAALIGEEALAVAPNRAPALLLEVIAGAVLQLIYARVLAGRGDRLEELLPTLMYMVLVALHGPVRAAALAGLGQGPPVAQAG